MVSDSQRRFAAWIGGSMFASLSTFDQVAITKQVDGDGVGMGMLGMRKICGIYIYMYMMMLEICCTSCLNSSNNFELEVDTAVHRGASTRCFRNGMEMDDHGRMSYHCPPLYPINNIHNPMIAASQLVMVGYNLYHQLGCNLYHQQNTPCLFQ